MPDYAAPPDPLPGERCLISALVARQLCVLDYQRQRAYQTLLDGNYIANHDACNRLYAADEDYRALVKQFVHLVDLTAN